MDQICVLGHLGGGGEEKRERDRMKQREGEREGEGKVFLNHVYCWGGGDV